MDPIEFSPPDGLALWIPLPTKPGKAYLQTGCEHAVRVGLLRLAVPEGFHTDGASIPGPLAWMIPNRVRLHIHRAGLFHDYGYRVQPASRFQIDALFRSIMDADGVPRYWAWICYAAVRVFGGLVWRRYSRDSVLYANRQKLDYQPKREGWHGETP